MNYLKSATYKLLPFLHQKSSAKHVMFDIYLMQYVSKSFKTNGEQKTCKQNNLPYAKFMNMICDLQCINQIFCSAHVSTPVYISVCTCLIFTLFTFPNLDHHSSPVPVPDVARWQDSIFFIYLYIQQNFHCRFSLFVCQTIFFALMFCQTSYFRGVTPIIPRLYTF